MLAALGSATAALKKLSADATTPACSRIFAISAPVAPAAIEMGTSFSVSEMTLTG